MTTPPPPPTHTHTHTDGLEVKKPAGGLIEDLRFIYNKRKPWNQEWCTLVVIICLMKDVAGGTPSSLQASK